MRNIDWFATAAAGAVVLTGMGVVWTNSSTQVSAASEFNQIEAFQIITKAKDLPDQAQWVPQYVLEDALRTRTFEDRTFVF
jgi:hypothetical protein